MLNLLRDLNEAVGKTMPSEVYDLTPKEADYILAGGYQRSYNTLLDNRFILGNTIQPVGLVGEKANTAEADKYLKDRQKTIKSLTDNKLKKQISDKRKEEQRFMDIFVK